MCLLCVSLLLFVSSVPLRSTILSTCYQHGASPRCGWGGGDLDAKIINDKPLSPGWLAKLHQRSSWEQTNLQQTSRDRKVLIIPMILPMKIIFLKKKSCLDQIWIVALHDPLDGKRMANHEEIDEYIRMKWWYAHARTDVHVVAYHIRTICKYD